MGREYQHQFAKNFYDFFSGADLSSKVMVEFGSGTCSTPYFAKKFKKVYSFENDFEWIKSVKQELSKDNIENVEIQLLNKKLIFDDSFEELVKTSDYFLIDHNPKFLSREYIALFVGEICKDNAFIILDNADINVEAYDYLKSKFYSLDFIEFSDNEDITDKLTSVFYYRRKPRMW